MADFSVFTKFSETLKKTILRTGWGRGKHLGEKKGVGLSPPTPRKSAGPAPETPTPLLSVVIHDGEDPPGPSAHRDSPVAGATGGAQGVGPVNMVSRGSFTDSVSENFSETVNTVTEDCSVGCVSRMVHEGSFTNPVVCEFSEESAEICSFSGQSVRVSDCGENFLRSVAEIYFQNEKETEFSAAQFSEPVASLQIVTESVAENNFQPAELLSSSEFSETTQESESDSDSGRGSITCIRPITVAGPENFQLVPLHSSDEEPEPPAYESETEEEKQAENAIIQEMVMQRMKAAGMWPVNFSGFQQISVSSRDSSPGPEQKILCLTAQPEPLLLTQSSESQSAQPAAAQLQVFQP
eukprot:EG_transcript_8574